MMLVIADKKEINFNHFVIDPFEILGVPSRCGTKKSDFFSLTCSMVLPSHVIYLNINIYICSV